MVSTGPGRWSHRRQGRPRLYDVGDEPDYRYSLANERTFLSWIRTSLALVAAGVAVIQFLPNLGSSAMRLAVGSVLIVIGGMLAVTAHHRWSTRERAMRLGVALPPNRIGVLLGYLLAAVAVAVLVVLFVTTGGDGS